MADDKPDLESLQRRRSNAQRSLTARINRLNFKAGRLGTGKLSQELAGLENDYDIFVDACSEYIEDLEQIDSTDDNCELRDTLTKRDAIGQRYHETMEMLWFKDAEPVISTFVARFNSAFDQAEELGRKSALQWYQQEARRQGLDQELHELRDHVIDSQTVLGAIQRDSYGFQTFFANRVREIQKAGPVTDWWWIPGEVNVADLVTRGCSPKRLDENSAWQKGPKFLSSPVKDWPMESAAKVAADATETLRTSESGWRRGKRWQMSWKQKNHQRKGNRRRLEAPMFPGGQGTLMGTLYQKTSRRIDLSIPLAHWRCQKLRHRGWMKFLKRSQILINICKH
ncbi:uncharacterized protein LOC131446412 [Solea solea]|uniref:uncharacterized protein LOC131446412 n=1 Tax=Solea solea TaxID=90069 RepID=UPI00272C1A4C|nr:uncharacterized protein LOC131446412 [Solea solea]